VKVLETLVDLLAVLLVFAPIAIQITKTYGIDPFQMGLVMGVVDSPLFSRLIATRAMPTSSIAEDASRHASRGIAPRGGLGHFGNLVLNWPTSEK
jgi:hypothetical protein